MSTNRNKKSPKASLSATRRKARLAVQRVDETVSRRLPRPRVGFENLVGPLARIIEKHSDDFGPGIDVELMRSSLAAYQSLEKDYEDALSQLAKVENTRLLHSSTVWSQILLAYNRGQSLARTSADIAAEIKPIKQFMKVGPRNALKPSTPTVPATTTTT